MGKVHEIYPLPDDEAVSGAVERIAGKYAGAPRTDDDEALVLQWAISRLLGCRECGSSSLPCFCVCDD